MEKSEQVRMAASRFFPLERGNEAETPCWQFLEQFWCSSRVAVSQCVCCGSTSADRYVQDRSQSHDLVTGEGTHSQSVATFARKTLVSCTWATCETSARGSCRSNFLIFSGLNQRETIAGRICDAAASWRHHDGARPRCCARGEGTLHAE